MIKRLIAAVLFVIISISWFWNTFASVAALFTFIPASWQWLATITLISIGGIAVFRLLDFDNLGAEYALSVLYLGSIALYSLTGNPKTVAVELVKNVVGFSVAFLIGIWIAKGSNKRNRRGGYYD